MRTETRDRVLQAALDLDFRPNRLARALVTARTHTIGAIVHDISDPYFGEIVRGLEDGARLEDYQVFVCSSDRDPERELGYVRALLSYRVDGLVFAGGGIEHRAYQRELARLIEDYRQHGGGVVVLAPHSVRAPSATVDNRAGAFQMTRHLVDLGHRHIGFIAGPPLIRTSRVRLEGYRAALQDASVSYDPDRVAVGWFTSEGGAKAVSELLERDRDITAVFAANDVMAFGVLHELAGRGIRVPGDISVGGFDDIQMAEFVHSPLTTVRMPMYNMGRSGARMVLDLLAGRRVRSQRLPVEIVVRSSTAPPGAPR